MRLQGLIEYLEKTFPFELAEYWDNVGLLIGDRAQSVEKVATCLTIDEAVADEAVADKVDCIVSHHPFPFHAAKKWTTDTTEGRILRKLIGAGIAVYSPHTAHDSALFGSSRRVWDSSTSSRSIPAKSRRRAPCSTDSTTKTNDSSNMI